MPLSLHSNRYRGITLPILALAGASALFAAGCGSSGKGTSTSQGTSNTVPPAAGSTTTGGGSSGSNSSVTVGVANVAGLGSVLVNGDGRTLYVLATEKGKVTCTDGNGCTKYWPPAVLPSGMTHGIAGSGVQASMLGSLMSPSGDDRLTYGGWPLYTYTGDSGAGQSTGQGVTDTWGTWWVLSPSGTPIMTSASSSSSTSPTSAPASGGAGF